MGGRIGEGMPRMTNERLLMQSIPDRSPGHAFIANDVVGVRFLCQMGEIVRIFCMRSLRYWAMDVSRFGTCVRLLVAECWVAD